MSEHLAINPVHRRVCFVQGISSDLIKLLLTLVFDCTCRASLENLVAMVTDAVHHLLRHFRYVKRRLTLFEEHNMSTQHHHLSDLLDYNVLGTSIMAECTLQLLRYV